MPKIECPQNTTGKKSLKQLIHRLEHPEAHQDLPAQFPHNFKQIVIAANGGDPDAISCVESWFLPSDKELTDYGIPESQLASLRKCTDKSLLLYGTLDKVA